MARVRYRLLVRHLGHGEQALGPTTRGDRTRGVRMKARWLTAVAVACARCGGERWPVDPPTPFVCIRCRAVLAGKNAVDPLGTPGKREAPARALAARLAKHRA